MIIIKKKGRQLSTQKKKKKERARMMAANGDIYLFFFFSLLKDETAHFAWCNENSSFCPRHASAKKKRKQTAELLEN